MGLHICIKIKNKILLKMEQSFMKSHIGFEIRNKTLLKTEQNFMSYTFVFKFKTKEKLSLLRGMRKALHATLYPHLDEASVCYSVSPFTRLFFKVITPSPTRPIE